MKRFKLKCGFTLIELLIVIAIIAVLVSILLPSLKEAKEQAARVVCLNNMRQYVLGTTMYADDYRGFLPCSWAWGALSPEYVPEWLLGSIYDNSYTTACPSNDSANSSRLEPRETWPNYYITAYKGNAGGLGQALHGGSTEWYLIYPRVHNVLSASVDVVIYEVWTPYAEDIWRDGTNIPPYPNNCHQTGRGMGYLDAHAEIVPEYANWQWGGWGSESQEVLSTGASEKLTFSHS